MNFMLSFRTDSSGNILVHPCPFVSFGIAGKNDWFMIMVSVKVHHYLHVEVHAFCAKQLPGD